MLRLKSIASDYGRITILKRRSLGSTLYEQDGRIQSEADRNGVSVAYYIHALFSLIEQMGGKNILMIGCGGGTLATMLCRSSHNVKVIDINPISFSLAKKYFALPTEVRCQIGDGETSLIEDNSTYDAIIIDAFQGSRIPPHLYSGRFYDLARRRLTPSGAIFINIILQHDLDRQADQVSESMFGPFQAIRILDVPGGRERNAIVAAGNVAHLQRPELIMSPLSSIAAIEHDLGKMTFRARR